MSDMDKLKEEIRQAISSEHSCKNNLCDLSDKRSYDRCICESDAAAALSAIEEAGYVKDLELCGGSLLLHEDDDGNVGGFTITGISGGADYIGDFDKGGFPRTLHLVRLDDENGPQMRYIAEPAAASAVWDEAVEACINAIKEVEEELAAAGEAYILVRAVEQMRALKRSHPEEKENA